MATELTLINPIVITSTINKVVPIGETVTYDLLARKWVVEVQGLTDTGKKSPIIYKDDSGNTKRISSVEIPQDEVYAVMGISDPDIGSGSSWLVGGIAALAGLAAGALFGAAVTR